MFSVLSSEMSFGVVCDQVHILGPVEGNELWSGS